MKNLKLSNIKKGFTLIELLVVIAIITVLAVLVFAALNPAGRLADARDARRSSDVGEYLTAVHECIVDADGAASTCYGTLVAGDTYEIVGGTIALACDDVCTGATSDSHCAILDTNLAAYLASLPVDPGGAATDHTEYSISVDANGIVSIDACSAEGSTITTSR